MRSVRTASQSGTSKDTSNSSRWPICRSASVVPWWVKTESRRISTVTALSSPSPCVSTPARLREDRAGHAQGLANFGDIVHSEDIGAALIGHHRTGDGAPQPLARLRAVDLADE